ncbi:hypothetical protein CCACVL1_28982 [Corchorus capsularis]|uniref:Uncharacterized protein n=1 Tax=Corchorus capsularis TaxID=210143 RepID=A0A1R3G4I9_COCAP|nr:hypothetical protein CCACVL1_28982 [Corchorus capsularis]
MEVSSYIPLPNTNSINKTPSQPYKSHEPQDGGADKGISIFWDNEFSANENACKHHKFGEPVTRPDVRRHSPEPQQKY